MPAIDPRQGLNDPPAEPPGLARPSSARAPEDQSWRLVVDAIPDAAIALDGTHQIVHQNRRVGDLFPSARIGKPISLASRNPDFLAALDRVEETQQSTTVQLRERVPVERYLSATIAPLPQARDIPTLPRLLVTFHDLTEQQKLEQMRVDFIANASHELRTPLASLRGYVETLQGAAHDDPAARERFLAIMWSQAMRMTRLVDDLLSLSRIEMRTHIAPQGVVDLNEVAKFVAQSLEPIAAASKITVSLKTLPDSARIRGDREELVQLVQNLLQNAIKYGRVGGRAEVAITRLPTVGRVGPKLRIEISDDGPGIADQHLPRLTERFYRINIASSREKGGTGLGLAIVKHIVLRHRGDLRIKSEIGAGSTFTVILDELTIERGVRDVSEG
ncbi:MAG: ATP-binding protein [Hyphomicrobiaceae bacterium]|nr:ATP-binding protein [Hyphomicrobiaceae bacterium]